MEFYFDEDTREYLTSEEYWNKKSFESQPFYRLGAFLREAVIDTAQYLSSSLEALKSTWHGYVASIYDYFDTTPLPFKKIDKQVKTIHDFISDRISNFMEHLPNPDKPILILIGEAHEQYSSYFKNVIILKTAKEKLGLSSVLTESFYLNECRAPFLFVYLQDFILRSLDLIKIPIDYASCSEMPKTSFTCRHIPKDTPMIIPNTANTDYGLSLRDSVMSNMIASRDDHTIAMVGAYHLMRLSSNKELNHQFNILSFNTATNEGKYETDYSSEQECRRHFQVEQPNTYYCFSAYSQKVIHVPGLENSEEDLEKYNIKAFVKKLS